MLSPRTDGRRATTLIASRRRRRTTGTTYSVFCVVHDSTVLFLNDNNLKKRGCSFVNQRSVSRRV